MSVVKTTKAVDTHAHVFSAQAPAVAGARYRPAYPADLTTWRAYWEAAGITHGVVIQPSFFGADNRELLDTIASNHEHLRGVAVLPPMIDDDTLARFHRDGVRAIRLNLRGVRDYHEYASRSWRSLYTRVHELGWHVECFIDTGRLRDIAPAFDGTPVAVAFDHFGAPGRDAATIAATFECVRTLLKSREVWCKFSAPYRLEGGEAVEHAKRWLEAIGPERIVWASDWPWTGFEARFEYGEMRDCLDQWVPESLQPSILWDNAARLYGFD
jgi:predicted TIM-barrel fold metal-dependent hydrolase